MPGTVLLIQNDRERRRLVHAELEPRGHTVIDGASGGSTHDLTVATRPDLVVVDSDMAGGMATDFLESMQNDSRIADIPILVANTSRLVDLIIDIEVQLQMCRLRADNNSGSNPTIDSVTGLYSPGHMRSELAHFSAVATRYAQPLSIVLVGLDRFEATNRIHGSVAGDEVLRNIAQRVSTDVRDSDVVGRWHADQFIAILPCTPKAGARFLAERFRETLAESQHIVSNGNAVPMTASFGCADIDDGNILEAAATALKSAKRKGRNMVSLAE